jgi:hypothetical protein
MPPSIAAACVCDDTLLHLLQELLESPHLALELASLMQTLPKQLDKVSGPCRQSLLGVPVAVAAPCTVASC